VDITKQRVLIFSPMKLELMYELQEELAKKHGVKVVTVDSKSKDVRGSDSFKTFNALVKGDGEVDANIVLATSILNTGVDIHDVFDHTWVLNSRDLSTVLQAYSRDRGAKNVFTLAVQERDFKAKIWDEDAEKFVEVPGERLKISTKPYSNTPDLSAVRYEEAITRDLLDDTTVYISKNDLGQAVIVNEIYEIQNSNYQEYIRHQMSPELLKRCFYRLNIITKHTHIGYVPFDSGADVPSPKKKPEVAFTIGKQWRDLLVNEINARRQGAAVRKRVDTVYYPMQADTFDKFKNDEEFKLAKKVANLATTAEKYRSIKAELIVDGLIDVCAQFRAQQQVTTLKYSAVEAVVIELGGRLVGVSGSKLVHDRVSTIVDRDIPASEFKVWLKNEFKPLITARGSEKIALKGLEAKLTGFGYEVSKGQKRVGADRVRFYHVKRK
ncbi:MAG: helicase-related protein, partial [Bacilli bacterium]